MSRVNPLPRIVSNVLGAQYRRFSLQESKSINFNKSIFYRAPCAEYIRCRHFDDDDVFFVRDIRVAERLGARRAGLRAAAVSRRVSGVRRKRGLGLWRKG